jgi:hypothetical protein
MSGEFRVGVISDTHGLLRPEAVSTLAGVDRIIHAGDIGSPELLQELRRIAPVTAVRGNIDRERWARSIPTTIALALGEARLFVIHDLADMKFDPHSEGFAAVISGHSHVPNSEIRDGVLFFNPGSAGPRRFRCPTALGFLSIRGESVTGEIQILNN